MIKKIQVNLPAKSASSYPIWINSGLLKDLSQWMPKEAARVVIITDNQVKKLYASSLETILKKAGYETLLLAFPAGEKSKNILTKCALEEKMLRQACDRETLILAIGGGVVGDLAGYIASSYMRGISYIQIPTSLLAMLDSSVGGKTGIDTPQGKNLIGAFWQPKAVISDISCLKTLPKKQLINGLVEAIKMFLTSDLASLNYVQRNLALILKGDEKSLTELVHRSVKIKARVVRNDEKENGERALLNFGHTIGHALEQISHYQLLHGYAVAYGILVEAKIAQLMGILKSEDYQLIQSLLKRLGFSGSYLKKFKVNEIIRNTENDKKKRAGVVNYVLLNGLGSVYAKSKQFTHPVPDALIINAFSEIIGD